MNSLFTTKIDRRDFLEKMSIAGTALAFTTFGSCEALAEAIANRPTRRRIRTGSPAVDQDVATYAAAVAAMKALPNQATNPRSWLSQATIHGTVASFNFCQHGTPHFFSWHRAYLFFFEKICQELTGEDDFGLPYWNWVLDKNVPSQFQVPASSLFEASRSSNSILNGSLSEFTANNLEDILDNNNFIAFGSQIETSPHNTAHWNIGGVLGQGNSPMDPLFWLHHCMVDYCWMDWNVNRENDNPNDAAWNNTEWTHFVDGNGNPASMTAGLTTIMPLLSYQYEESQIGTTQINKLAAVKSKRDFQKIKERVEKGAEVNFEIGKRVRIAESLSLNLKEGLVQDTGVFVREAARIISNANSKDRVFAAIDFVKAPPTNDFLVRVFVNLPEARKDTPLDNIHYAGSFSFFGTSSAHDDHSGHGNHRHHQPKALVNLTDALRRLKRAGRIEDASKIELNFVTVPFDPRLEQPSNVTLQIEDIDIVLTSVEVNP